jgi:adenine-specific DNA-methyltransferase
VSRLNDLIRHVARTDPQLAKDLQRETDALADRRAFGLNFERHVPEAVELPGRPVRKNDKVRILPERGQMPKQADQRLYRVTSLYTDDGQRWADVEAMDNAEAAYAVPVDDLVVVAEFRDPIYPGLVSTGKIERGGDKPFHTVINSENYHALQALLFTHRGKVDCIYIDPPYNTGARDWKYNNDYVESDDHYRHSKWLAMMERRLVLAKELLNPADSVLIVTIDEKEFARLALLLEQTFPEARIGMVSSVISQKGVHRDIGMNRVDEYLYFVFLGAATLMPLDPQFTGHERAAAKTQIWYPMMRTGTDSSRDRAPGCFFPVLVDPGTGRIVGCGDALPRGGRRDDYVPPQGLQAVFPIASNGSEARWQMTAASFRQVLAEGMSKLGKPDKSGARPVMYIRGGMADRIRSGEIPSDGPDEHGVIQVRSFEGSQAQGARTQWNSVSHDATLYGTNLNKLLLPDRRFPFPKSLYAVEDTLRWYLTSKSSATVVDFFAGSGTTAHAVMRLNKQDGGRRSSISITNNEVSADEQRRLRTAGLRPGDTEWEQLGICAYITKPRIEAAVQGATPNGSPIVGDYKFTDEFPMAAGFEENVEFFTLTYESAMRVSSSREFAKIAPFLWLRAGSRGRRIGDLSSGWDVADTYGVIANLDLAETFIKAVEVQEGLTHAFIVTDEDRLFEAMARQLPPHVEPVRLYSSYLRNFEIEAGRAAR